MGPNLIQVLNPNIGDQPPKPVKAILKVEKNRDGKTGKTTLYFDYSRSRVLTNEKYMDEFGKFQPAVPAWGKEKERLSGVAEGKFWP